jgi:predicted nucleotidyltransferase
MNKTALSLTEEELKEYRISQSETDIVDHERLEKAWNVAVRAAQLLRQKFGASKVKVFGSLSHQLWFTRWSDIDLAVWGIQHDEFYRAVAAVTGLDAEFQIDLVDAEHCSPAVHQSIEQEGKDI